MAPAQVAAGGIQDSPALVHWSLLVEERELAFHLQWPEALERLQHAFATMHSPSDFTNSTQQFFCVPSNCLVAMVAALAMLDRKDQSLASGLGTKH